MEFDRRTLLLSLASSAAMLALPERAAAALQPECFAASRKDDRGNFSAALFTLEGDVQAIELPGRGHDIALRPDGGEWVAFARRPGRFGVAMSRWLAPARLVRLDSRDVISSAMASSPPTADCSTPPRTTTSAPRA